ncbi:hypothetical protein D3C76_1453960 [compost metagenome]
MDPTQAAQGLQVDRGITHRQVAALHQRIAELPRQVQVFEIAFVETPRRQQDHQGRLFIAGRLAGQGLLEGTEKSGQVLHLQVTV